MLKHPAIHGVGSEIWDIRFLPQKPASLKRNPRAQSYQGISKHAPGAPATAKANNRKEHCRENPWISGFSVYCMSEPGDLEFVRFSKDVPRDVLERCSRLFSSSYGVWGAGAPPELIGKRVRMSTGKLEKEMMFDGSCYVVVAMVGEDVVGHAFCRRFYYEPLQGTVVWIMQLVVHPAYRRQRVAANIISNAVYERSDVAAGLVSSNPFAVRALEVALKMRVVPELITRHASAIIHSSQIPYIQHKEMVDYVLNTNFFVDHSEVNRALTEEVGWKLGTLNDGEEFVAIVFHAVNIFEESPAPNIE